MNITDYLIEELKRNKIKNKTDWSDLDYMYKRGNTDLALYKMCYRLLDRIERIEKEVIALKNHNNNLESEKRKIK